MKPTSSPSRTTGICSTSRFDIWAATSSQRLVLSHAENRPRHDVPGTPLASGAAQRTRAGPRHEISQRVTCGDDPQHFILIPDNRHRMQTTASHEIEDFLQRRIRIHPIRHRLNCSFDQQVSRNHRLKEALKMADIVHRVSLKQCFPDRLVRHQPSQHGCNPCPESRDLSGSHQQKDDPRCGGLVPALPGHDYLGRRNSQHQPRLLEAFDLDPSQDNLIVKPNNFTP